MAAVMAPQDALDRKELVFARHDMPGIPAGTRGKVTFVEGFTWIRYWVRFENGVIRGSINRKNLATRAEWQRILDRRAQGLPDDETASAASGGGGGGAGADGEAAAAGAVVNGVSIPAFLLERSQNRRAALGK